MLFSSSAQRWEILKKYVELSIKSQSDTRWESRIKCIKPLRYNLKEVLLALKDLEAISIERKDGRAASETKSLIAHLSKRSFLLSVFIWYDILFQVNKASKILQSYRVSLHTMETEIQATEKFLQNYRPTGYDSAATSAVEIAQELDIDPSFPPSRSGKKRRLFDYQGEEEQRATPELKFKSNFFYPLVDQAIMSIKERFNLTCAQGLLRLLWGGGRSWSATGLYVAHLATPLLMQHSRPTLAFKPLIPFRPLHIFSLCPLTTVSSSWLFSIPPASSSPPESLRVLQWMLKVSEPGAPNYTSFHPVCLYPGI